MYDPVQLLQFNKRKLHILQRNLAVINTSETTNFHLDGHVNKQNCRYWAKKTLENCTSYLCIIKMLPLLCFVKGWNNRALFVIFLRWPWTNSGGELGAICGYASGLFIPYLVENELDIPNVSFQKKGATAHSARVSMNIIRETFSGRLISRNGDIPWPSRLHDLSPCDFLWVYLKFKVHALRQTTHYIPDLNEAIQREITVIRLLRWQKWWVTSMVVCKNALMLKDTIYQE